MSACMSSDSKLVEAMVLSHTRLMGYVKTKDLLAPAPPLQTGRTSSKMKRGGFGAMKQNKYDDPAFFANYRQMARSIGGLDEAGEWPAFRALLPTLRDKTVLDLGCGFGWIMSSTSTSSVARCSTAWYRRAASSFRSNTRSSQRWLLKTGITVRRGSAYIGLSITIRTKARVRPDF